MPSNRSKIVSLTTYGTNKPFTVSSVDIISFKQIGANDTTIRYVSHRDTQTTVRVTETVSAINTACISNGINMMIPITLASGVVLYLNIDRVIYVDALSNSSPLVTRVTYDGGLSSAEVYDASLPTPANFNSVTDNTFNITTQGTTAIPSRTRYINNLFIANLAAEPIIDAAQLQLFMKPESYTVSAAGAGYTSTPTVDITSSSGVGSGATATATMKLISATVAAAGSGYDVADTITFTGGTAATDAIVDVATVQLVSAAVNAAGTGYNIGDTITLSGGTASTDAILTVATLTGGAGTGVATFTITTPGDYTVISAAFTQGATSGGGTGATFNTGLFGVLTVTVNDDGSYTVLPTNPASQGATSGGGTGATHTASWGVETVVLGVAGSGYDVIPDVDFVGGGGAGAVASAVLEVDTISVTDGGEGYESAPTVGFSGGGGSGATATASIDAVAETVTSVAVTAPGGSYTSFPTVTLTGGSGGTVIFYDEKSTEYVNLEVTQSVATIKSAVNAL